MSALFELPVEVTRALAALLEPDDIEQLAVVSRAAIASAVFHTPTHKTLLLPPTNRAHVGAVLSSIVARDPTWLAGLAWVQVATPWHVELLVELGVAAHIQNVRVRTEINHATETVHEICDKLCALPKLTKLDLSEMPIQDLTSVATMMSLRWLSLNNTEIANAAPLAALEALEHLQLRNARVVDMQCIANMTELNHLEVTYQQGSIVSLPRLQALANLHTLRVESITIERASDFEKSLSKLRCLSVLAIHARSAGDGARSNGKTERVSLCDVVARLAQLEDFHDLSPTASTEPLPTLPSLRIIRHNMAYHVDALAAFQRLEDLRLQPSLDASGAAHSDYRFLLKLPVLKKIAIVFGPLLNGRVAARETKTILTVLAQMPQLERLHLEERIDGDIGHALSRLRQLQHLSVRVGCDLESLHWIKRLRHSLRSLSIEVSMSSTNLDAIGSLKNLSVLNLVKVTSNRSKVEDFACLSSLGNLRKLSIDGNIRDLAPLGGLTKLRTLEIRSTSIRPIQNYDVLGNLTALRCLDISSTKITDLSPLLKLHKLRRVVISSNADCRVLAKGNHPSLLHLIHPFGNCLWSCSFGTILEDEEIA